MDRREWRGGLSPDELPTIRSDIWNATRAKRGVERSEPESVGPTEGRPEGVHVASWSHRGTRWSSVDPGGGLPPTIWRSQTLEGACRPTRWGGPACWTDPKQWWRGTSHRCSLLCHSRSELRGGGLSPDEERAKRVTIRSEEWAHYGQNAGLLASRRAWFWAVFKSKQSKKWKITWGVNRGH